MFKFNSTFPKLISISVLSTFLPIKQALSSLFCLLIVWCDGFLHNHLKLISGLFPITEPISGEQTDIIRMFTQGLGLLFSFFVR